MSGEPATDPVRTVMNLYEAIRDRRISDMLALVDPKIACFPLVRPEYSVYCGHDAMVKLVDYMHEVHGEYRLEIGRVTVRDGPRASGPKVKVTVEAAILPEPGPGRPRAVPVTSEYTVENGLITWIVSKPAAAVGHGVEGTAAAL